MGAVIGKKAKKWKVTDYGKSIKEGCRWVDAAGRPLSDERMAALGAKKLTGGWHSSAVWLLPGNVVEKRYGTDAERAHRMEIEVDILTRLADCDFVPKLLDVDRVNKIVRMTYCGKKAPESNEMRKQLHRQMKVLEEKYGVYRKANVGKKMYMLGCNRNVTMDDTGKLFIIDFGSDNWHIKPPGPLHIIKQPRHQPSPNY